MSATDGDRGWACSQSPQPRATRTADSVSWPEPAQVTVASAGAGVLLHTQAEALAEGPRSLPPVAGLLGRHLLTPQARLQWGGLSQVF